MRIRIAFLALVAVASALPQTPPTGPLLNSGVPNIYTTLRPLLTGASNSDPALNPPASSLCANSTPICVLTAQYDNARTDANAKENMFTVALAPTVVRLGSFRVDTSVLPTGFTQNPTYAQPLYVPGLSIGGGTHNVVFIVALNGEVYAYDADNILAPIQYWYRDETNPHRNAQGQKDMLGLMHNCDGTLGAGSSVPKLSILNYLDFAGVISTPVIDVAPVSGNPTALYFINLCQDAVTNNPHWYINSLNLTTGQTLGPTPPLEIAYNAQDVANNPYGPQQQFQAGNQLQRSGLLLTYSTTTNQRSVIAGFGTSVHENSTQYQGWMFAFDVQNPSSVVNQEFANPYITQCFFNDTGTNGTGNSPACTPNNGVYNATLANPCGQGGGVWMSARGPASNANREVFFANGNGGFHYCPTCGHHCAGNPTTGQPIQKFTDFGEAVMGIKMQDVWSTTGGQAPFWPIDYFVPNAYPPAVASSNQGYFQYLNSWDRDLGVSGTLLFDDNWYDALGTHQNCPQHICPDVSMLLAATKRGDGYVLLQGSLGQIEAGDTGEVNNFLLSAGAAVNGSNPLCTALDGKQCDEPRTPALWQQASNPSVLVVWPWFENLASFQWKQSGGTPPPIQLRVRAAHGQQPFQRPRGVPRWNAGAQFQSQSDGGDLRRHRVGGGHRA
jgi:hypothetical protein